MIRRQRRPAGGSGPLNRPARERHRRSLQRPYRRVPHRPVQRSDGWIETTWNNMSDSGCVRGGGDRGAGRRRAATAGRRWCRRLPDGVRAGVRCGPRSAAGRDGRECRRRSRPRRQPQARQGQEHRAHRRYRRRQRGRRPGDGGSGRARARVAHVLCVSCSRGKLAPSPS